MFSKVNPQFWGLWDLVQMAEIYGLKNGGYYIITYPWTRPGMILQGTQESSFGIPTFTLGG